MAEACRTMARSNQGAASCVRDGEKPIQKTPIYPALASLDRVCQIDPLQQRVALVASECRNGVAQNCVLDEVCWLMHLRAGAGGGGMRFQSLLIPPHGKFFIFLPSLLTNGLIPIILK